ncbi:MAG: DinB family protein [Thermomicrobiales bacterium]
MRADDLRLLFDYSYAATGRVLDAAGRLEPGEFTGPPPLRGAMSLQDILVHTLGAERGWREFLRTGVDDEATGLDPAAFPGVPVLTRAWREDEARMREWLDTLDDEALDVPEAGRGRPIWVCLTHVINHSTQHRSEAAMILSHLGQSPGDLDFTFYLHGWTDD